MNSSRVRTMALAATMLGVMALSLEKPVAAQTLIAPGVLRYGDADLVGFGYPVGANPMAGATLTGLAPGATTTATNAYGHNFPFSPSAGDYAGMDRIYVGSVQTAFHDGYSQAATRINGPQTIVMDYNSLVAPGQVVTNLTLGIAADDFQFLTWGQPFTASINGVTNTSLANVLMALNQTGPFEQFVTVGIQLPNLNPSNILTLTINGLGDGGDGWAVDFTTIGLQTAPAVVPEHGTLSLLMLPLALLGGVAIHRRRSHAQ